MSKTITVSDNTWDKIKDQVKEEKPKTKTEILNKDGDVIHSSDKGFKETVEENYADLRGADLCGADLRGADLCGADLCGADLRDADLCDAELENVKFYGKGGTTKIKKNQIDDFFKALGIIVE